MIIGTFAPIPNKILCRRDLSHGAKLCCARLIQYAGKDGKAFPKLTTLVDELGMSKRAVQRFLAELEENGLITTKQRGRGQSNMYSVDKSIVIHIPNLNVPKVATLDTPLLATPEMPKLATPYRRKENFKKELEKITAGLVHNMRMPR
jgi:DNA-binding transcriptional ArsR family regulator